ncbi:MAG: hypothetical protein IT562_22085 [Alphaproteobacteria bacterium]|nr:hypothetical protein [Alphaproteobacteria bacterium]
MVFSIFVSRFRDGESSTFPADVLSHLPDSRVEAMGIPWVKTDAEQIRDHLHGRASPVAGA